MRSHEGHGSQYSQCKLDDEPASAKGTRFIGPAHQARWPLRSTHERRKRCHRRTRHRDPQFGLDQTYPQFALTEMWHTPYIWYTTHSDLEKGIQSGAE